MISSLVKVLKQANATGVHEFKRKEIDLLLNKGTEYATFGDWIHFGGIFYKPKGRGYWGLNIERAKAFLSGKLEITIEIKKTNHNPQGEPTRVGSVRDVPHIKTLLNEAGEYQVFYVN